MVLIFIGCDIYFLIPVFYPEKLLKTVYNLHMAIIINGLDRQGMLARPLEIFLCPPEAYLRPFVAKHYRHQDTKTQRNILTN